MLASVQVNQTDSSFLRKYLQTVERFGRRILEYKQRIVLIDPLDCLADTIDTV